MRFRLSRRTLAWKIPCMEEPGGLQSMGSLRVGHNWSHLAAEASSQVMLRLLLRNHTLRAIDVAYPDLTNTCPWIQLTSHKPQRWKLILTCICDLALSLPHPSVQFSSVAQSCPTLCSPMDCSMPGFPVLHYLLEFAQTHVHWGGDTIQPSHPLSSPSPSAFNLPRYQGLFQWVSSLHQVAKVLELQLQHQSFPWIFGIDFL